MKQYININVTISRLSIFLLLGLFFASSYATDYFVSYVNNTNQTLSVGSGSNHDWNTQNNDEGNFLSSLTIAPNTTLNFQELTDTTWLGVDSIENTVTIPNSNESYDVTVKIYNDMSPGQNNATVSSDSFIAPCGHDKNILLDDFTAYLTVTFAPNTNGSGYTVTVDSNYDSGSFECNLS